MSEQTVISENSTVSVALVITIIGAVIAIAYVAFTVKRVQAEIPDHSQRLRSIELNTGKTAVEMENLNATLTKLEEALSSFVTRSELDLLKSVAKEDHDKFDARLDRLEKLLLEKGSR